MIRSEAAAVRTASGKLRSCLQTAIIFTYMWFSKNTLYDINLLVLGKLKVPDTDAYQLYWLYCGLTLEQKRFLHHREGV